MLGMKLSRMRVAAMRLKADAHAAPSTPMAGQPQLPKMRA